MASHSHIPRRAALLPLLVIAAGIAGAEALAQEEKTRQTYTWVDENGQRVFSDRPREGADTRTIEIDVPERSTDPFSALEREREARERAAQEEEEAAARPADPPVVNIVRPAPEETIVNTGFRVQVGVSVEPRLPTGGRVLLYLDGALAADGSPGQQSFLLEPVYRGEHTVSAAVVDAGGRELSRSAPVTFFVRQASILSPP